VINGVIAVPLIGVIILLASKKSVKGASEGAALQDFEVPQANGGCNASQGDYGGRLV
jgi:hypothetical protein